MITTYTPTPAEIAAACRSIQAAWTPRQRIERLEQSQRLQSLLTPPHLRQDASLPAGEYDGGRMARRCVRRRELGSRLCS
jgi:hypothetical protein